MKRLFLLLSLLLVLSMFVPSNLMAQDTIFLPLVSQGKTAATAVEYWPDGSIKEYDPLGHDIFNLPVCDVDELNAALADGKTEPVDNSKACKLTPIDRGMPLHIAPAGYGETINAASVSAPNDAFMPRKFSLNQFYCPTCADMEGVTGGATVLGETDPLLTGSGQDWYNYWYANYLSIGDDTGVVCQDNATTTLARFTVGVGKGRLTNNDTMYHNTLYHEKFISGECKGYTYGVIMPNGGESITVEIYKSATGANGNPTYWTGRALIGGTWSYLFQNVAANTITYAGHLLNVGQEVGTYVGNGHTNVHVGQNFAHKIKVRPYSLVYKPFYVTHLPYYFASKVAVLTDSGNVLRSLGAVSGVPDFTSRTSFMP